MRLYAKQVWGDLALTLAAAEDGDGSHIRQIVDEDWYGTDPDTDEYDNFTDLYFTLTAIEQRYRRADVGFYLDAGNECVLPPMGTKCRQTVPFAAPQAAAAAGAAARPAGPPAHAAARAVSLQGSPRPRGRGERQVR